MKMDKEL